MTQTAGLLAATLMGQAFAFSWNLFPTLIHMSLSFKATSFNLTSPMIVLFCEVSGNQVLFRVYSDREMS